MRKSLLVVLLVAIVLAVGCNSSDKAITVKRSFHADEVSTWNAVVRAAKTFSGREPQSINSASRTLVINGVALDDRNYGTGIERKAHYWKAVVSVNPKDMDARNAAKPGDPKNDTWVVVKTSSKQKNLESSEDEFKGDRSMSMSVEYSSDHSMVEKFFRVVQDELDKNKAKPFDNNDNKFKERNQHQKSEGKDKP